MSENRRVGKVVERNICHGKPNKAVITQLREEKHTNVFFFFSPQRRLLSLSHSEQ